MGKYKELWISLFLLWGVTGAVLAVFMRSNDVAFVVYTLDDPYIHMALARNLAESGVFGVTRHAFSSSTSSPLWTLIVAGASYLVGVRDATPLILNLICASGLLALVYGLVVRHLAWAPVRVGLMLAVVFCTPLVPVVLTGMEHMLHTALSVLFLYRASRWLSRAKAPSSWDLLVVSLLTATRYEGLFAVLVVCALLTWRRKYRHALLVVSVALFPLVLYGAFSMLHGSLPLPNTLISKVNRPESFSLWGLCAYGLAGISVLIKTPHLLVLVLVACFLSLREGREAQDPAGRTFAGCFVAITWLHLQFAKTGWFYRYEAYLVVLGLVAIAMNLEELRAVARSACRGYRQDPLRAVAAVLGMLCLISPLAGRGLSAHLDAPTAMTNIYQQQFQMGLFLKEYYRGRAVAANDVGAISFLADIRLLDLQGLATVDVIKAKVAGRYDAAVMRRLAEGLGVHVAIVYDAWFAGQNNPLPESWICVARWRIPHNVVCSSDTVSFYAIGATQAKELSANLESFAPRLPAAVVVTGPESG